MSGGRLRDKIKENKFIKDFLKPEVLAQFKRYVITGVSCFALEYLLFYLLLEVFHASDLVSNIIALTTVFWVNFFMNRIWSFKSKANLKKQLLQYLVLYLFNLCATTGLIYVLSHILLIDPRISKIIVQCAVVSWNFLLYKKVIYKE
ncbi:MAG: GtrA family protein [Eubacteriales bacterium]|nr:GtrA family protein [Eubacteriales bacterium]